MNQKKYDALEKALIDLSSGKDFTSVIAAYPNLAGELEATKLAQSLSPTMVPIAAIQRSRTQVLTRAMQLRREALPRVGFFQRIPRVVYVMILAIFFLISWNGLINASAQALPGDHLYPAKISLEKLHLGLALNPKTHQEVEEEYQARRVGEVKSLLALGRLEFVQFFGIVEHQSDDYWIVEEIEVRLLPETIILGDIQNGMIVEVEGATQTEGWVQASEIHLQNFSFSGAVELITRSVWTISGRDVQINSTSLIDSDIQVGDIVVVEVNSDDFGNLTARSINLYASEDPVLQIPETPIPPGDIQDESTDTPKIEDVRDDETGDDDSEEEAKIPEPDEHGESGEPDETDESDESDESDETDDSKDADEPVETDESDDRDESDDDNETDEKDQKDEPDDPEDKDKSDD